MKTLLPQRLEYGDYALLEDQINDMLWELVYRPVVEQVRKLMPKGAVPADRDELLNAGDAELKRALKSGQVQMTTSKDLAMFNLVGGKSSRGIADAMRSFGAKLDKVRGAYTCPASAVPGWVRAEATGYTEKSKAFHSVLDTTLKDLKKEIADAVKKYDLTHATKKSVKGVDAGWKASAKGLEVGVPELNETGMAELAKGMAETAKIPIKDFAIEAIERLRDQVEENAEQGYRAEGLAERIRNEYAVSKARAQLIARQETANFMVNYRKARATEAGCTHYIWRSTNDDRVRAAHKAHNGRKFRYDDPPIVDPVTGRRGNPGNDFFCRCIDLPVLERA